MSGETATEASTFAELLDGQGPAASTCRRCGATATHRVRFQVTRKRSEGGQGNGAAPGVGKTVATHGSDLCERCAVQLFAQVRKVMR